MNEQDIKVFINFSNWIEGVIDEKEDAAHIRLFENIKDRPIDVALIKEIHTKIGHQNAYSKIGEFRDGYDITVGGRSSLLTKASVLEGQLDALSNWQPKTYNDILRWHLFFEFLHPFGDGNGRTGRLLMLMHWHQAGLDIFHDPFLPHKLDYGQARSKYYNYFKTV